MTDLPDPNASTAATLNRKLFVGLSAGAVAASAGVSSAEPATFGKPHPPIVPPDDPSIVVARVQLHRPDIELPAYAAWPASLTPATPGIVMVHHIWGVDSTIRDDVRRYAKAGFVCIAPELFARSNPPIGDGSANIDLFRPAAGALVDAVVQGDLLAARDWIDRKAAAAKIGITGFCMGGGIALKALIGTSDYAAASIFYGDVRPGTPRTAPTAANTFDYASKITARVRGNYGERDTSIAAADVRALFALLQPQHELSLYPQAGHAFFDDTRASYVESAATDAWSKTLAWFNTELR